MRIIKQVKSLFNSLIVKLIALIIVLAFSIVLTLALYKEYILGNESVHQFFFLLVIIILMFALAIYFIHRLLLPVKKLTRGIKEVSKGNLDIRLKLNSSDEIGLLAKAFNQMTKDLQEMIQAKEQLLFDVSHEIQTPITRSKLALEMAGESKYIVSAKKNLKEVEEMIKELLSYQRLKKGFFSLKISKIEISDLIHKIENEYTAELNKLRVNPVSKSLRIEADLDLIKIVIRNVVNNALKYSADEMPITISVADNGDKIVIQIEDSGPGINNDELDKVFEPFYRTDKARARATGGYGLGLPLCKKIVDAHNGEINIYNKKHESGLVVDIILAKNIS